jgi:hypothetical protein
MNCSRPAASAWRSTCSKNSTERGPGKEYLRILELAAKVSEAGVDEALRALLNRPDEEITAERVKELLHADDHPGVRDVEVAAVDLRLFDRLCFTGEVMQ